MKSVLQILLGLVLCFFVVFGLMHSNIPLLWEARYPDGSYPITWRSGAVVLGLIAVTQLVAFWLFRVWNTTSKNGSRIQL